MYKAGGKTYVRKVSFIRHCLMEAIWNRKLLLTFGTEMESGDSIVVDIRKEEQFAFLNAFSRNYGIPKKHHTSNCNAFETKYCIEIEQGLFF